MPNEVLVQDTATSSLEPINFGDISNFNPTTDASNYTDGTAIDVDMDFTGIAAAAGHMSAKADLGVLRAMTYSVFAAVNFTGETGPTAGGTVDFYWAPSTDATAGEGNIAGGNGTNAACSDAGQAWWGSTTQAEFLQMGPILIGRFGCSNDATVQGGFIGMFQPPTRWGQLVLINNASDPFEVENLNGHAVLHPLVPEIQ